MTAHPNAATLAAYPQGLLGSDEALRVERHVDGCTDCRSELTGHVERPRLDALWAEVLDVVDAPRPRLLERALTRIGVPADRARLLALAPALRESWVMALALTALYALGADRSGLGILALAPLIPLLGVHLAYSTAVDATSELTAATPRTGLALLLQRTLLVLAGSLLAIGLVAAVTPASALRAGAWLLPSLAVCAAALALSRVLDTTVAFGGVAGTWLAFVGVPALFGHDRAFVMSAAGQALFAGIALLSVLALVSSLGIVGHGNRRRLG
jgi:hypothetical protein